MTIMSIHYDGSDVLDVLEIRRLCLLGADFTFVVVDASGQTNLLTSSDYKGETFLLKNNEVIVIRKK